MSRIPFISSGFRIKFLNFELEYFVTFAHIYIAVALFVHHFHFFAYHIISP
jgi:hypothetical protein